MTQPEIKTLGKELIIAAVQAVTITLELIRYIGAWLLILASAATDLLISKL